MAMNAAGEPLVDRHPRTTRLSAAFILALAMDSVPCPGGGPVMPSHPCTACLLPGAGFTDRRAAASMAPVRGMLANRGLNSGPCSPLRSTPPLPAARDAAALVGQRRLWALTRCSTVPAQHVFSAPPRRLGFSRLGCDHRAWVAGSEVPREHVRSGRGWANKAVASTRALPVSAMIWRRRCGTGGGSMGLRATDTHASSAHLLWSSELREPSEYDPEGLRSTGLLVSSAPGSEVELVNGDAAKGQAIEPMAPTVDCPSLRSIGQHAEGSCRRRPGSWPISARLPLKQCRPLGVRRALERSQLVRLCSYGIRCTTAHRGTPETNGGVGRRATIIVAST